MCYGRSRGTKRGGRTPPHHQFPVEWLMMRLATFFPFARLADHENGTIIWPTPRPAKVGSCPYPHKLPPEEHTKALPSTTQQQQDIVDLDMEM